MKKQRRYTAAKLIGISFLASVCICAVVIFVANDVFAFASCDKEETVVIPDGAGTDTVSSILAG